MNNPDNKGSCETLTKAVSWLAARDKIQTNIIKELQAEIKTLKGENQAEKKDGETKRSSMEVRLVNLENRSIRKNLVFKGLPIDGVEETTEQTKGKVKEALDVMGISEDIIDSVHRFKKSSSSESPERPPAVLVRLRDVRSKSEIFRNVNKLRDTKYKLTIANEYPNSLKHQYKAAAIEASKMREKSEYTLRTRLVVARGTIQIKVKGPNDKTFRFARPDKKST